MYIQNQLWNNYNKIKIIQQQLPQNITHISNSKKKKLITWYEKYI